MSIENARVFYQRMTEDNNFRSLFETALTKEEKQQLIKNAGYEFTADEWQAVMTEIEGTDFNEELKEEELEAIAGGFIGATMYGVVIWNLLK
jgi:predicted ribosomally synthesized peptide with nif11-like leader